MRPRDEFFLPGVSFTLDGETVPARELCWAMYAPCGCVSGMHMMTQDTITESAAWKQMSGTAAIEKRDRERGFTIKMVKHRAVSFDDCPHSPKWGFMPPPTPPGHTWATTSTARTLHLVPLTPLGEDEAKEVGSEWEGDSSDWRSNRSVKSLCGKSDNSTRVWSQKWYRKDGKVECSSCVKAAEAMVLL